MYSICFPVYFDTNYAFFLSSGTPFLATHCSQAYKDTSSFSWLQIQAWFSQLVTPHLNNWNNWRMHEIGSASLLRCAFSHLWLHLFVVWCVFFPLLATFSEHFSIVTLRTFVKRPDFLLQLYCNPSSLSETRHFVPFLRVILYTHDSEIYDYEKIFLLLKIFVFSALYEIFHFKVHATSFIKSESKAEDIQREHAKTLWPSSKYSSSTMRETNLDTRAYSLFKRYSNRNNSLLVLL